jgi:DNA polymerase-3 subunit alpha
VYGSTLAEFQEGLIVLSGCSDSLLACSLFGGKMIDPKDASYKRAERLASAMKELLGDRFYLECQLFPELDRSVAINTTYETMSKRLKIPIVATGDVHTLRKGDHILRAIIHAAGRGNNTIAQQMSSWEYDVPDYVPPSDEFMLKRAKRAGLSKKGAARAIATTAEIAERCNVVLPKAERFRYNATDKDLTW